MDKPSKAPSLLVLALILVALAVFGFIGARTMLSKHAANTEQQLALVWPELAGLPQAERNFLVELALTCNVSARPATRAEVVECLRSVSGGTQSEAGARLERLLGQEPAP